MLIFFNGSLMRGLPDHNHLKNAHYQGTCYTAPVYRLFNIGDRHPGMFLVGEEEAGFAILGEVYEVDELTWQYIASVEPPNLYRGHVWLQDGQSIFGMLYPRELCEGRYMEISRFGSWRKYVEAAGLPMSKDASSDDKSRLLNL